MAFQKPPSGPNPLDKMSKAIVASRAGAAAPYVLRENHTSFFFTDRGLVMAAVGRPAPGAGPGEERGFALKWGLADARPVSPRPDGVRPDRTSQYLGNRPEQWAVDQSSYSSVVYEGVQAGVDLKFESQPGGLEYTLQLAPRADPSGLHFRYEGAGIQVSEDGTAIEVRTEAGVLKEDRLVCYQTAPEGRRLVDAAYRATGPNEYSIVLGEYDPDLPLTVDPMITWSTYLAGSLSPYGEDDGYSIAADSNGNVFVAGVTYCVDFPVTAGALSTTLQGSQDGFLIKLSPAGTVLWGTYIGGSGSDFCNAVTVDASGNAYLTGWTASSDFPTTAGAYQTVYNYYDAFVMKFSAAGALSWSTFLGGSSLDYGQAIAVDGPGNVYVGGYTYSSNFPTPGGFKPSSSALPDGFVSKLNPGGTALIWSSYLGGNNSDYVYGLAVDSVGAVYVTGYTYSTDFPTAGGVYPTINKGTATGSADGFLTKINPAGSSLAWSSYLGGSSNDYGYGVCVTADAAQDPVVVGTTYSSDFYCSPGCSRNIFQYSEAFVTRFLSAGTAVVYSTFVGGNGYDYGQGIAAGSLGQVYVTGYTGSTDFKTISPAYATASQGGYDGFVTCLNTSGTAVTYSTYVGGNNTDFLRSVAVVNSGSGAGVYVAGSTYSTNYSTPAPGSRPDPSLGGQLDAVATKLPLNLSTATWSTYIGGANSLSSTYGYSVAVDPNDSTGSTIFVVGYTDSSNYPTTSGAFSTVLNGQQDIFLSKITMSGASPAPVWSTYLGGSGYDYGHAVAVDALGYPYVVGYTTSSDYPLYPVSPPWPAFAGGTDVVVTEFTPSGALYYSRYLGGPSSDYAHGICVDSSYNAYIIGHTWSSPPSPLTSTSFPATSGAYQTAPSSTPDAFVTKLNVSGAVLWSTYLAGNNADYGMGVACDPAGANCYVSGYTQSTNFPATVPGAQALQGPVDGFVASFTGAGAFRWSRYLGGNNYDYINAMTIDSGGTMLYVTGYTSSTSSTYAFPATPGAIKPVMSDTYDAFLTQLAPTTGAINWSTYLGGSSYDEARSVAVDSGGNAYVAGNTYSGDFPTKWPLQTGNSGLSDAFLAKIYSDGSSIAWSTMLGGSNYDYGYGVAVAQGVSGVVYLTGQTSSVDFPTVNPALRNSMGGLVDTFVVRLDDASPKNPDFAGAGGGQFRADGVTALPVGAWTSDANLVAKALLNDPNDYQVQLQVEIQPISTAFTGSTIYSSVFVPSGSVAAVAVPMPTSPTQYHWRARSINTAGLLSGWKSFGGNADSPLPAAPDVGRDTVPPVIAITAPTSTGTYYTPTNTVGLSGTDSDDASGVASVLWSNTTNGTFGSATLVAGGSWSVGSITLALGANTINVVGTDAAGNSSASSPATIIVYFDNVPPSVAITSNTTDFATNNGSPTLSGTASDNFFLASVTWSNSRGGSGSASISGGTWSAAITGLQAGANVITITATDGAGNTRTTTRTITYDNTPPTIAITSPASSPFYTAAGTAALSGTAGDNLALAGSNPISWKNVANGQTGTTSVSGGNWTITSVPLLSGSNTIQVTATDSVGNQNSTSIMVYEDTTSPSVSITSPSPSPSPPAPPNTYVTGATTVSLSGNSSDDVSVVSIGWTNTVGGTVQSSGNGTLASPGAASSTWTTPSISLVGSPSVNVITVTVKDEVGRATTTSINVTSDSSAPSVGISIPAANPFFTNAGSVPVSGTASDNTSVSSIVCKNTTTSQSFAVTTVPTPLPQASVNWSATPTLQIGLNSIAVTATNAGSTSSTATTTVIYDPIPPTLKITGPTTASTYYTGSSLLALAGTASDNQAVASITWSTTGAVTPTSGSATGLGPWSVPVINLVPGSQVITVTATDQAGNSTPTTLTVVYDAALPSIAITSPTSAATFVTAASTVSLGGTTSDDTAVASVVWVNAANGTSGVVTPSGSTWNVLSISLQAGDNPISVIATDLAGNVQTASITVSYDTAAPTVKIKGPTSTGAYSTNAANVAISGTASDDTSVASVTWSNAATAAGGTATGKKSWTVTSIGLNPGDNVITVTATDPVGNTATDTITVTYDPTHPTVVISSPNTNPYSTAATPVNLAGTANAFIGSSPTPVNPFQVTWANITTGGSGVADLSGNNWSAAVALTTGSNGIQVTAFDGAGNTSTQSITVVYDPATPLVQITSPTTDLTYATASAPVLLGGTASDAVGVSSVSWSSTAAVTPTNGMASGTAAWSASVPLAVGTNVITVTGTNVVGTTGIDRITITYDPIPPTVDITTPTSNATFSTTVSPLAIGGSASDNVQVQTVTWANTSTGDSGLASGVGTWSVSAIPLVEGNNVITVTATDEVGNASTATLTVSYNNIPPTVTIDPPPVSPPGPPYVTQTRPLTLTGTASDPLQLTSVTWTNSLGGGGSAVLSGSPTSATWSASIYFFPGDNVLTFTATDDHGLTSQASVTVTFNPVQVAPTLNITAPISSGSTTSSTQQVTVSGNADDVDPIVSVTWVNQATGVAGSAVLTPIVGSPTGVTWSANVPLTNGTNVLVVTAQDDAGNTTPSTITINYTSSSDAIPPAITITGPTLSGVYNDSVSPLLITMDAIDNVGIASISWSNPSTGGAGTAVWQGGSTWTVAIAMAVGANPLTFTAYDPSGNQASAGLVVNFVPNPGDSVPPVVTIVSPTTAGTNNVSVSLLTMSGTASDNAAVATVVWSNSADSSSGTASGTTTWSTPLLLQPGINVITVHAYDTSGNNSKDQVTVLYTPPPPPPPPPVHIPAGACGLLGLEVCLPLMAAMAVRRSRREPKGSKR